MASAGFFTTSDRTTITKAARLAEDLTARHFGLASGEWRRHPYGILTRKDVSESLYKADTFAHVVRFGDRQKAGNDSPVQHLYGVLLQDPNILHALFRSERHDLWTLGLFILTHELTHILRFRIHGVNFLASVKERDEEEKLVQAMTREILAGVANTDYVLGLYEFFD